MTNRIVISAVLSLPLFAVACGSKDSTPQPSMCYSANLVANEANNYQFSSTITLPPVTVKSMTNLQFQWGDVTHDFLKHQLNAASDLNLISTMMFLIPLSEVEKKLNDDSLVQGDLYTSVPASWPAPGGTTGGMTSAMLYDFQLNGTPLTTDEYNHYFDPASFPASSYSYVLAAATGTELGKGYRMLQSFNLDPASSNTTVKLTDDSTKMTFSVNLHSLTITGVPAGTAGLSIDWTDMVTRMAKNAVGTTFKDAYITSAVVGHYKETPAELETKFLDLDRIAMEYYRADIDAPPFNFTTLKEEKTGADFPGINDQGTWLVGLICGNCRNPAPWYMTILKPCTM